MKLIYLGFLTIAAIAPYYAVVKSKRSSTKKRKPLPPRITPTMIDTPSRNEK